MADELKACPFCGGEAYTDEDDGKWLVSCCDCYAIVGEGYDCDEWPDHMFATEAEAIAAWNTRAKDPALEAAQAEIAHLKYLMNGLANAYELLCNDTGKTYHLSASRWYSHARAPLESLKP